MGKIWRWRDNPNVIAHLIPEKVINGLSKRDIVLNPGEAMLLLRDGKMEDVVTQTRLKKLGGGLANWWARWRGHESGTELLFLITTPIELEIPVDDEINLKTKDYQQMYGSSTIRFQFLQENVPKIINLMERRPLLTKTKLIEKVKNELIAMVYSNQVAKYNAEEFHGNVDILKNMETSASVEMRKTFAIWGLHLLKMYTVWGKNAHDEVMEYKAKLNNIYEKREAYTDAQLGEKLHLLEKEHEKGKMEHEQKWDLHVGDIYSEEKVKDIQWVAEIGREERKFESDMEMQKKQFEMEHDQDQKELEMAMKMKEQMQQMKLERQHKETELEMSKKQQELDFKTQQMAMQTESTEKIMAQALEAGVADSESVQEMIRQQTMQKALDRESDKVEALSEAEKTRYNMDSFKSAEDRERGYETKRMELSAKQMEAAKQNVPQTMVQGASSTPVLTQVSQQPQTQQKVETTQDEICWNCAKPMEKESKNCPHCGEGSEGIE